MRASLKRRDGGSCSRPSLLPYAGFAFFARKGLKTQAARIVAIVAAALLSTLAFAALYATFVAEPDAQGGLVFLFLPVWQLIGLLPFWFCAYKLETRASQG